jgi:oligopeptide transport system substrate-binding protein
MHRFFFCFFLFLASCSSKNDKDALKLAFHTSPSTLDPRKANDFVSSTLMCLLYEGLMRNLPDGSVEPALAERIEISEDLKTYTFYLRDAYWSDGEMVTAHELEASWKKGIDPKFPSLCAYLFYPIKHSEAIAKGEKSLSEASIWALDAKTLQVELERPCPYFLSLTAFSCFFPVPMRLIECNLDEIRPVVVNGPFCFDKGSLHSEILLKKNPFFWNKEQVHLTKIHIQIVSDETTSLHLFEQKQLDWLGGALSPLSLDGLPFLKTQQSVQFSPMAATTFCSFNTARKPLDNKRFRQALSLAINREEIVRHITQMEEVTATRYLPPALMKGENKNLYPSHDLDLAKTFFKQALLEENLSEAPQMTLIFRSHLPDKQIAQLLQKQWQDALGIYVQLQETDTKTHKELLHQRNYDLALSNWIAQVGDPINILERFKDVENSKNYPAWQNAEFNHLLQQAMKSTQPSERTQWIELAEELIAQEMPLAPIYHWTSASLCQPRLHNLYTTPNGGVLFERSWLSEP